MILGSIYNEWYSHQFFNPRLFSVLGQIGASYFISTCIYLFNPRSRIILASTFTIWILITALHLLPDGAVLSKNINPGNNINSWIDSTLTPGRLLNENHDLEGALNWLSASSVCLLGTWTSRQITQTNPNQTSRRRKTIYSATLGISLISLSLLADNYYPIIKNIWTAPFAALTGGISILLYLLIRYIVDIKSIKKPFFFSR